MSKCQYYMPQHRYALSMGHSKQKVLAFKNKQMNGSFQHQALWNTVCLDTQSCNDYYGPTTTFTSCHPGGDTWLSSHVSPTLDWDVKIGEITWEDN